MEARELRDCNGQGLPVRTEPLNSEAQFSAWVAPWRDSMECMAGHRVRTAASRRTSGGLWGQLDRAAEVNPAPPVRAESSRVTVDLRELGPRLQAFSAARGLGVSTVIRRAVLAQLDAEGSEPREWPRPSLPDDRVVKLSVRLKHRHAGVLAARASEATVSRGTYLASLLDGMVPPAQSPEHRQAVAALLQSTQKLAVLSADLSAFLRMSGARAPAVPGNGLADLSTEVRAHLRVAARLVARLTTARSAGGREESVSAP